MLVLPMFSVYILGVDGAGKTTLMKRLAQGGIYQHKVRYLYCQHRPILLWILKAPARLLFMRRTDQFADYSAYKARKDSIGRKSQWMRRVYAFLGFLDVTLQTLIKLHIPCSSAKITLFDRYYLDWVVNAGVLKGNSLDDMLLDAHRLERFLPLAHLYIFLHVSEAVALRRKDDIQSFDYLRERTERYMQLAPHYCFHIVDADQDAESVFQQVRTMIQESLLALTKPDA